MSRELLIAMDVVFSLAIKNPEDNGTTKKVPASSDLLGDSEQ